MAKLNEGKALLQDGDSAGGAQLLEEAISLLHGGLSDEFARDARAAGGASGTSEWSVMPDTVVREVLAEARFLAGTAAQKEGKWQRALLHFQSAMRDCPGVVSQIPAFLYGVATSEAVIGEDLDSALKHFRAYEKAIREGNFIFTNLQNLMLQFNIGQTLVRMQRDEEAVRAFQAVFAKGKEVVGAEGEQEKSERQAVVAAAHYWCAVAVGARKKHADTIAHLLAFEKSVVAGVASDSFLERDWDQRYRVRLISAMLKSSPQEHMQMAVSHAKILCELAPENPMFRRVLGDVLFHAGDIAGAAEAFRYLLQMPHSPAPQDINVLLNLARCLHDLGELDSSRSYFELVLAQQPSHVDATLGLAAVGLAQLRKTASLPANCRDGSSSPQACATESSGPASGDEADGGAAAAASNSNSNSNSNSLRTPREEWMENQGLTDKQYASDAQSSPESIAAAAFPSALKDANRSYGCDNGLAAQVLGALSRLRSLLQHRSSAGDMAIRAEALVLEAELHDLQDQDGASASCQEELLRAALLLCPNNFTALLRLAAIFHEQGKSNEVARLLAQAESLSGKQSAEEIRRHLASGSGGDLPWP